MADYMLILDGLGDEPHPRLNGKTPLEASGCRWPHWMPNVGRLCTTPEGFSADSLTCILTLLGVPPEKIPRGRAYLESLPAGIPVGEEDLVLRCNLSAVDREGRLVTSGAALPASVCREMAEAMAPAVPKEWKLCHLGGYKNLLVLPGARNKLGEVRTVPPHQNLGEPLEQLLPAGFAAGGDLTAFTRASLELLAPWQDENRYLFFLWDPAAHQVLPSFEPLHGGTGAMICKTEIVKGMAQAMKMDVPDLRNATADVDTDLTEKLEAALAAGKRHPVVVIHLNGADEAAHRHRPEEKSEFIARVERQLIDPLYEQMQEGEALLITSDHSTLSTTGRHRGDPQTFWMARKSGTKHGKLGDQPGCSAIPLLRSL